MAWIPLTQGKFAIVDDDDFEWLSKFKWSYTKIGTGYAYRTVYKDGKYHGSELMHRIIINTPKGYDTDHINGDTLDNRKNNLRMCTHKENLRNRTSRVGISKYKGVYYDTDTRKRNKRWRAEINFNGGRKRLGRFLTEEEAALAYNEAALEIFGEYARLNDVCIAPPTV